MADEPTAEERLAAAEQATREADARTADVQGQLDTATQTAQSAAAAGLQTATAALKDANPHLPAAAFAGDDIAAVTANVNAHNETATSAREQAEKDAKARIAGAVPTGGGTHRQPEKPPEGTRGASRIRHGLDDPQSKYRSK